ncbi:TetR/AcrR family transcriptional regulator C-terminal domain-containing protein [Streptosporangium sp. NBC_01756]|uniref:TetR/AcrR family transcriptional regulator C-terminal domain-containing protein n=1 Tax=Streptosporangium sp. NBC_01756 TaxID=2975950 RepID=UPI002DDBC33B|nr:TetR/AcrR family transcriptional regulator C-terminal domain-containing protein [Streptosporangium sp. NBC_01756]WSC86299.1 TetR/AcrR family transcriptional regulator C-terminal domain-containing protein [Streptosporangium sp. NBC_01756]
MKLDRGRIIATALQLLDEVGLDQLTLRRLASELGVQAPALYWHFANKQELLDEMADALTREIPLRPLAEGEPWQDWLADRMRNQRRMLNAHRDAARLFVGARPGPSTLPMFQTALESLRRAGFPPREALRGLFTLGHYVTGFVLEEQAQSAGPPQDDLEQARHWFADHPALFEAVAQSGHPQGEETFEHGLSTILNGMRDHLTSSPPPS